MRLEELVNNFRYDYAPKVRPLDGFVDAGQAVRQARGHLLSTLPHRRVATFDVDQLLDYRSRRPPLRFASTYWADYEQPELDEAVRDELQDYVIRRRAELGD